jgi:uncharacterized protein (DUF2062 family)
MNFRWTMRRLNQWGLSRRKLRGGFLHTRLGDRLLEREIWVPSRESLARAFLVGMPVTMIPFLPLQSVFACALAFWLRANLPVTFFLQFLSSPATAIIQIPACYLVGRLVLGGGLSAEWTRVWADPAAIVSRGSLGALYLGAVVLGVTSGIAGYFLTRLIWREKPARVRRMVAKNAGGVGSVGPAKKIA